MTPATVIEVDPRSPKDLEALGEFVLGMDEQAREAFMLSRTDAELDVVARGMALKSEAGWRATPTTMAVHLTAGRADAIKAWRYSLFLGHKFRQAVTGESTRQIWNIQARYGKSLIASHWGPAWAFDRDPTTNLILASYGDELAMENADAVRGILREHSGVLNVDLRRDRQRIDRFRTTAGGGLLAAGIDSTMSGFPADGAVVDDPFKNWQEAHSEARRKHVLNQYKSVIRLRLDSDVAWLIIVHNRWHEEDLSGELIKAMEDGTGEPFDVVRMPTIAEAPDPNAASIILRLPDPLGRAPGEPLELERFSAAATAATRLSLGSYLSAAMMQQRPSPEEGNDVKRDWFRLEERMPARADEWLSSWDTKMKDSEAGDFVVGQVWARTGKDYWLMDQLRGQWDFPTTVTAVALMAVRWPDVHRHAVEAAALGPEVKKALSAPVPDFVLSEDIASQLGATEDEQTAVEQMRRRGLGGVILNPVKGDKRVRLRTVTPVIEAGDVHVWARATYLGGYLDEMAAFPNGSHDDQVDSSSQALLIFTQRPRKRSGLTGSLQQGAMAGTV